MKIAALAAATLPPIAQAGTNQVPPARTYILDGIWGWHLRWEGLRKRVEKEVGPCQIWHYDNSGRTSLEKAGTELAKEIAKGPGQVNLVGYSMGGLVIREALRQEKSVQARNVVLLHSPNNGSLNGHFFPMLPACQEMRPGSSFIQRLNQAPWSHPTLVSWCPYDLVVFPGTSARWGKATQSLRSDVPVHAWPVVSKSIHNAVVSFLLVERAEPAPAMAAH